MRKYSLTAYQLEIFNEIINLVNTSNSNISVNMPTGTGKTIIMMTLAEKLVQNNNKILISYSFGIFDKIFHEKIKEFNLDSYVSIINARNINALNEKFDFILMDSMDINGRKKVSEFIKESKTRVISFFDCNQELQETNINWDLIKSINSECLVFKTTKVIDVRDAKYIGAEDVALKREVEYKINNLIEKRNKDLEELHKIELEIERKKNRELEAEISRLTEIINNNKNYEIFLKLMISSLGINIEDVNDLFEKINGVKDGLFIKLQSEDENIKELAYKELQDKISKFVIDTINSRMTRATYDYFEQVMVSSLTTDIWNKLDENSKRFLVTAKTTYEGMIKMDERDSFDYSGVCLLMTKALEVETSKRFFTKFINYLFVNQVPIERWSSALKKFDRGSNHFVIIDINDYTLGSVCITAGYYFDKENNDYTCSSERVKNLFVDFCRNEFFVPNSNDDTFDIIWDDILIVEKVRKDYRNPAAHKSSMLSTTAKECMDYMIDVQCALKTILSPMIE